MSLLTELSERGLDWIIPQWPVANRVQAVVTTRNGGISPAPYASMNLGGQISEDVRHNRTLLDQLTGARSVWLKQQHGVVVVHLSDAIGNPVADAAVCRIPMIAATVLIADCLPILLCDRAATVVAAVHAGWRGLAAGVVEKSVAAMRVAPDSLIAWLGPAIGPQHFEVGEDVHTAFCRQDPQAELCFISKQAGKWRADLYQLARQRLAKAGVIDVYGGGLSTASDASRFYSHRRDGGVTGRMAALVWLR